MTSYLAAVIIVVALAAIPLHAAGSEGVSIERPALVDATGSPIIDHINVNQKFYIATNIFNDGAEDQEFVYIVQVTDESDTIVLLDSFSAEIAPGQRLNIAISWVPTSPGTYTAEVFLWDSIHDQNALDASKTLVIPIS